ncbi:hypothetical protein KQX54_001773 [Cotesia glomerata]|uniref:Uncharacterized protein n=1 Tax=Cotesia glomerata TaxID=32391 RepID=A0AAV7IQ41_COTGL|nr:hypothetical protein KQX54_001773 [Cotesia glomerata]
MSRTLVDLHNPEAHLRPHHHKNGKEKIAAYSGKSSNSRKLAASSNNKIINKNSSTDLAAVNILDARPSQVTGQLR